MLKIQGEYALIPFFFFIFSWITPIVGIDPLREKMVLAHAVRAFSSSSEPSNETGVAIGIANKKEKKRNRGKKKDLGEKNENERRKT